MRRRKELGNSACTYDYLIPMMYIYICLVLFNILDGLSRFVVSDMSLF